MRPLHGLLFRTQRHGGTVSQVTRCVAWCLLLPLAALRLPRAVRSDAAGLRDCGSAQRRPSGAPNGRTRQCDGGRHPLRLLAPGSLRGVLPPAVRRAAFRDGGSRSTSTRASWISPDGSRWPGRCRRHRFRSPLGGGARHAGAGSGRLQWPIPGHELEAGGVARSREHASVRRGRPRSRPGCPSLRRSHAGSPVVSTPGTEGSPSP